MVPPLHFPPHVDRVELCRLCFKRQGVTCVYNANQTLVIMDPSGLGRPQRRAELRGNTTSLQRLADQTLHAG